MYYEIVVDGVSLGVYGHPGLRSMDLSVMTAHGVREVFASGVCVDDGEAWMYDWLQQTIAGDANVEIRTTTRTDAATPRGRHRMTVAGGAQEYSP